MSLQIIRTDARLNIETTRSQMNIQSKQAKLDLKHKEAKLDIHTELPRVVVDQYECFAGAGLMSVVDLTREAGQRAMQQALTYAAKVAGDGESMAAIENKSDPIPDIAWRNGQTQHEFGIDYIPKARPRITVVGGGVQITSQGNAAGITNGVSGTIIPGEVKINYIPSQIKINIAQYASVKISYEKDEVNTLI